MRRIGSSAGRCRGASPQGSRPVDECDLGGVPEPGIGPAAPACPIVQAAVPPLPTVEAVVGAIWNRGFVVAAENQPLPPLPASDPLPPGWDYPGHFRKAAADHLARVGLRPALVHPAHHDGETVDVVREQMHPRVALANLVRAAITTGDNVLPPTAPGVTPVGTRR